MVCRGFAALAYLTLLAAPVFAEETPHVTRPPVLTPLEIAFVGLQVLDTHSTLRASAFGGHETNPLMRGLLGSTPAVIATKAGMTAGVILVSERLWKRNKIAAVLVLIGLNAGYAVVVQHNYVVEGKGGR
jgi:hypothetical protein